MADNDHPGASPADAGGQPVIKNVGVALALGAAAVAAGGVVLVVAVTWGAAEAAVGVGAAFLVYTALTDQQKSLAGLLAVRLIGGFRRPPPAPESAGGPTPE